MHLTDVHTAYPESSVIRTAHHLSQHSLLPVRTTFGGNTGLYNNPPPCRLGTGSGTTTLCATKCLTPCWTPCVSLWCQWKEDVNVVRGHLVNHDGQWCAAWWYCARLSQHLHARSVKFSRARWRPTAQSSSLLRATSKGYVWPNASLSLVSLLPQSFARVALHAHALTRGKRKHISHITNIGHH